jgi:glycosyltransferase involved in cell wall biosynthesis
MHDQREDGAQPSFKSVHITNFYHKDSGGISTSYNNLLAAATRHRRHVRLIVPGATESVETLSEFAKIYYIPARHSPLIDRRYRVMMPWQYMRKGSAIRKILLEERPDMIEVTDKYTLSLIGPMIRTNNFRRLGRPMLVHFSCERMDDNIQTFLRIGSAGKWLSDRVIRYYHLPSFDFHIANSEYTAAEFFEAANGRRGGFARRLQAMIWKRLKAPGAPIEERVHVCHRGVNVRRYNPDSRSTEARTKICRDAGVPETAVLLFYAGRLSPEKNIGLLLDTMEMLAADDDRDYRLLIAGDGPRAKRLAARAERHIPERSVQLGHVNKDQLARLYANTDVFVHPNPREPFGIAPLEAMASGLPLVAPNSGGILSYANDSNAWLTEPNARCFAAAVRDAVTNEPVRQTRIDNALATVDQNRSDSSAERLLETYDRLYAKFTAKRAEFTGEISDDSSAALAKWVTFGLLGGLTYIVLMLDLDNDPASYFRFF